MANSDKKYLEDWQEENFPRLTRELYEVKSDATPLINANIVSPYNCIAFAAGDDTRWWEPDLTESIGNSSNDDIIEHPSVENISEGWFKKNKKEVPLTCPQAGMKSKMILPTMELPNL